MPTLVNSSIREAIKLLNARGICFHHACQLQDLVSYIKLGGIPSRKFLQDSNSQYTGFDTDEKDVSNGVWDKVFGNLADFGRAFASHQWPVERAWTPNPYGPIVLIASPEIFLEAEDVAVCLRSAGSANFNRYSDAISTPQELNEIFEYPIACDDLKQRRYFDGHRPEVSCTVPGGFFRFNRLSKIIVDDYGRDSFHLLMNVYSICSKLECPIQRRHYRDERQIILKDFESIFPKRIPPISELEIMTGVDPKTQDWARRIRLSKLEYQYERFASYLREGTLLPMCR